MPTLQDELVDSFQKLSPTAQLQSLKYIRNLQAERPRGTPGKEWVKLAGSIDAESLAEMSAAIEEASGQDEPNEW